jgi:hypothetical protein
MRMVQLESDRRALAFGVKSLRLQPVRQPLGLHANQQRMLVGSAPAMKLACLSPSQASVILQAWSHCVKLD